MMFSIGITLFSNLFDYERRVVKALKKIARQENVITWDTIYNNHNFTLLNNKSN